MSPKERCTASLGALVFAVTFAAVGPAAAAGQRSFVATSGVDNPACSLPAPCRTLTAAVAATNSGGEVIVLTSGGYGAVTITQSVTIITSPGIYAGISVSAGVGITITTAAADSVTLRGLTINNVGTGIEGILFNGAGRLHLADVTVTGFSVEGFFFAPSAAAELVVERSSFSGNGWGFVITPGAGAAANAVIDGVTANRNTHQGLQITDPAIVTVRRSTFAQNAGYGIWALAYTAGQVAEIAIESSSMSNNTDTGVVAGGFAGTAYVTIAGCMVAGNGTGILTADTGVVRLSGSTITRNATGITYFSTGVAQSQGNNFIYGNTSDGTAPTIVGAK